MMTVSRQRTTRSVPQDWFLAEWISNKPRVFESVPENARAPVARTLSIGDEQMERTLGVCCFVDFDTVCFKIDIPEREPSRRNLISIVSTVSEPLVLASPFILPAKALTVVAVRPWRRLGRRSQR